MKRQVPATLRDNGVIGLKACGRARIGEFWRGVGKHETIRPIFETARLDVSDGNGYATAINAPPFLVPPTSGDALSPNAMLVSDQTLL